MKNPILSCASLTTAYSIKQKLSYLAALSCLTITTSMPVKAALTFTNHWSFDQWETGSGFVDSVGGKNLDVNPGSNVTTTTLEAAPGSSASASFTVTSSMVYSDNPAFHPSLPADNFAMDLWVRPTATTNGNILLIGNGRPQFQIHNGQWAIGKSGSAWGDTGVTPVLNTWTHLAYVYDSGVNRIFIDGAEISAANFGSAPVAGSSQLLIGATSNFTGYLDEVRFSTFDAGTFTIASLIPEPSTYALASGIAALGVALAVRRRRAK